jgi:hypothetical protein
MAQPDEVVSEVLGLLEPMVVQDGSLKAFIDEGLQTRGVHLSHITVSKTAA